MTAAFKEVEENCELGHVTEKSITAATAGLKKMADVFVGTGAAVLHVFRVFVLGAAPEAVRVLSTEIVQNEREPVLCL